MVNTSFTIPATESVTALVMEMSQYSERIIQKANNPPIVIHAKVKARGRCIEAIDEHSDSIVKGCSIRRENRKSVAPMTGDKRNIV
jgi:hypothetical protein